MEILNKMNLRDGDIITEDKLAIIDSNVDKYNANTNEILNTLGSVDLATNDKTVKGGLNEVRSQLNEKANEIDNTRTTTSKTVTGAINELNSNKRDLTTKIKSSDLDISSNANKVGIINLADEVIETIANPLAILYTYPNNGIQLGRDINGAIDVSASTPNRFLVNTVKIDLSKGSKIALKTNFECKILVYSYNGNTGLGYIDFINYVQGSYISYNSSATAIRITIVHADNTDIVTTDTVQMYQGGGALLYTFGNGSVTTEKIADGSIINSKLVEPNSKIMVFEKPKIDIDSNSITLKNVIASTDNFLKYWNMTETTYTLNDGNYLIYNMLAKTITIEVAREYIKSSDKYILFLNINKKIQSPIPMYQCEINRLYESREITNGIIKVGKDTGYKTINAALAVAKLVATKDNPINIKISPGIYEEVVLMGNNNYISLVGENKYDCVLIDKTGLYNNSPLRIATGYVANMTIISNHDNTLESDINNLKGYAVHSENDGTGTLEINNCILVSYQNAAYGCGVHENQNIKVVNTELYSYCPKESSMSANGSLFVHNQYKRNAGAQSFTVDNCKIVSQYGVSCRINDTGKQLEGTSINSPLNVTFYNSMLYSNELGKINIISVDTPNDSSCISGEIILNKKSFGNNIDILNK